MELLFLSQGINQWAGNSLKFEVWSGDKKGDYGKSVGDIYGIIDPRHGQVNEIIAYLQYIF
jgi:hypothetical protein